MEVQGRLVALAHGVEDQHGIRLEFATQARHVGESRVSTEAVVAVVVAHLVAARGDDQALVGEEIGDLLVPRGKEVRDRRPPGRFGAGPPVRSDEFPELCTLWLLRPVVSTILQFFLCHASIVPPSRQVCYRRASTC